MTVDTLKNMLTAWLPSSFQSLFGIAFGGFIIGVVIKVAKTIRGVISFS